MGGARTARTRMVNCQDRPAARAVLQRSAGAHRRHRAQARCRRSHRRGRALPAAFRTLSGWLVAVPCSKSRARRRGPRRRRRVARRPRQSRRLPGQRPPSPRAAAGRPRGRRCRDPPTPGGCGTRWGRPVRRASCALRNLSAQSPPTPLSASGVTASLSSIRRTRGSELMFEYWWVGECPPGMSRQRLGQRPA